LYSPGYGAGWSTWNSVSKESAQYLLEYKPLIDFIESGKSLDGKEVKPIVKKLEKEFEEKFGRELYTGGLENLKVVEVEGRILIREYDGYESIVYENGFDEWV